MTDSPLAIKMRALAAAGHDHADELSRLADDMEAKAAGFYGQPQTATVAQMVGAWARARKLWCACTGESLA